MSSSITRPMLAASEAVQDLKSIRYPVLTSPKIDGIRCLIKGGKTKTRKFKSIPNDYIREQLEQYGIDGMDGEITIPNSTFNEIQSQVMRFADTPSFRYLLFDFCRDGELDHPFSARINTLRKVSPIFPSWIQMLPQHLVHDASQLATLEKHYLGLGYEGLVTRDPAGPYKLGRSTRNQEWALKIVRFEYGEAKVVGLEEGQRNENPKEENELGLTKRSHKMEGMVPNDTLGKFVVQGMGDHSHFGIFQIGTGDGLTHALRQEIWDDKDRFMGQIVRFKYKPYGVKDKPRMPIWTGFRDREDIDYV